MSAKTPWGALLGLVCLLCAGSYADAAADPNRIAAMLTAAITATGDFQLTYDKVSAAGDDITLTNVKLTTIVPLLAPGAPAAPAVPPAATTPPGKPATPGATGAATPAKPATSGTATAAKPPAAATPAPPAAGKPAAGTATGTAAAATTARPAGSAATPPPAAGTAAAAAAAATGPTSSATFPTLVISGAVERQGGGFTAKRIAFDGGSAEAREGITKWATGALQDVVVPSAAEIMAHAKIRPFSSATLGNLAISRGAKDVPATVAAVSVTVSDFNDTTPAAIHLSATGAKIPVGAVSNAIANAMLSRMGYTEFDAAITMDSSYDTTKNSVALNSLLIDAAQVGKITLAAQMSDTSIGGIADPTQAADARAAAKLVSVSLRFDDAGFVGRMLDMQAEVGGGTRADVVDGLVYGALPFVLNYIQNTAFRAQFTDAASTFLANPKNIAISAMPAMPVPLGEVLRTAIGDPLKLPDLLSLQVAANK